MLTLLRHVQSVTRILVNRNAAMAALLIALLLAPSFAHAAFSPAGIFSAGGGAGIGCAIGFVVTLIIGGAGCLIGGAIGGGLGFAVGWFSGLADKVGSGMITFALWILRFIGAFVVSVLLPFAAELLQAGIILNIQSITDFPPVQQASALSSNLANLILVAVFIIIGLATVLGLESYGMRRNLPLFILIVLIVNFSTVFVDLGANAGNVFMNFFWENSSLKNTPLSALILGNMKISSMVSQVSASDVEKQIANGTDIKATSAAAARAGLDLLIIFLGLFATYVIFRMGLVFILRIGILWLLVIIAPLIFAVSALPPMRKHLQEWWKQLLNWAFIGPATFFFFFFGLLLWVELNKAFIQGGQNATSGGAAPNTLAAFAPFYMFPLVMIFFMVAIKISKQMAGAAANGIIDGAMKIGKGVALGTVALGAGAALAGTGKGLSAIARGQWVKKAGEGLQRRGFTGAGKRITALHEEQVKKKQDEIKASQGVYEDFATTAPNTAALQAEFQRIKRFNPENKMAFIRAVLAKERDLSPEMLDFVMKRGKSTFRSLDTETNKLVKDLYPNLDEDIYVNKDPSQGLNHKVLLGKFKSSRNRHRINLSGIADENQRREAFLLLAAEAENRSDRNRVAEDHDMLRYYSNQINHLDANQADFDHALGAIAASGFDRSKLNKEFETLKEWSANAVMRRSTDYRSNEPAPPPTT